MTKKKFIAEVRRMEPALYHIAKSVLKNDADCADAVQEALLRAYEKLDTLKKETYFRTWLTRILLNECCTICRKNEKLVPYEEYMETQRAWEEGRYTPLYHAILELPLELRVLVTLYYLEGFSQKEICEITGLAEGTVKSRLYRARNKMKENLDGEEANLC